MKMFVGLDWGSTAHAVCLLDESGRVSEQFEVAHDADGLGELRRRLAKAGRQQDVTIAIERPTGVIVDTLMQAGYVVVPIHPNIVKACRPRYRAALSKSDAGDAYLLADVLRTDGHRFSPLSPQSDAIKALRARVRTRDDLVTQRIAVANQLRALLESFWPGAAIIYTAIDSDIALNFLQQFPTPRSADRLGEKRLAAFLRKHRYCGRKPAAVLLERLRGAAIGTTSELESEAKGELVRSLAAVLSTLTGELSRVTAQIETRVAELPDGQLIMSFPRAGRVNAAQMLAELGDVRERYLSEEQLAAEAGVCPVTRESGKARGVAFRWACNQRLRRAICLWADNTRHASMWANDVYRRARQRGCDHPHAVRVLARAWIRVLWRAWYNRSPYDASKHVGAARFRAAHAAQSNPATSTPADDCRADMFGSEEKAAGGLRGFQVT